MQLHNLPQSNKKKKKRVGRGGKRGTYSGRGVKGQKARAGNKIRPAERDLIMSIPKRRGFKNPPTSPETRVFNLDAIERAFAGESDAAEITKDVLRKRKMIPKTFRGEVKILGDGEISQKIAVDGIKVSKSAREKIEAAGGKVT